MSTEKNVEIIGRAFKEVFDRHNVAAVDDLYAADYIYHSPGNPDYDRERLKQDFTTFLTAFPDERTVVEDIFGSGDKVASRYTCIGTHSKPYQEIPASNKQIIMTSIIIHRLEGGKVVEDWEWSDKLGFMMQLDLISVPGVNLSPPSMIKHPKSVNLLSPDENIAIERGVMDRFNLGDIGILDKILSPIFVYHGPTNPDWDREETKVANGMMHTAFPDWKITMEDIFATTDKAAYRISIKGTHLGELWGVPPTGKKMGWTGIIIDHFSDGKIIEMWEWMDFLGLNQQLGLVHETIGA